MDILYLMIQGGVAAALFMTLVWGIYLVTGKPSIVDIGWTTSMPLLAGYYYGFSEMDYPHATLIVIVLMWSIRLNALLMGRILLGQEDRRYQELSKRWETGLYWKYFLFFQFQALAATFLSLPIAIAMLNQPSLLFTILGTTLFCIGVGGEHLADETMRKFRKDPKNKGTVCRDGLWKYSRHPNYFFEWINWLAFATFALGVPFGWIGLISPLAMLFFILKVTGVPPTEEILLASKGDAYREYQNEVSPFFPWFPSQG